MSRIVKWVFFAVVLSALPPAGAWGQATYTAADCNQSSVNAVINGPTHKAVNGDTIVIPAGTCTWTSGITVSGVGIDITGTGTPNTGGGTVGAGASNTTLIDDISGPFFTFTNLSYGETAKVELLTMSATSGTTILAAIQFTGNCTSSGCGQIRVDNITFSTGNWESTLSGGMVLTDNVFGVLDHNTASETPNEGGDPPIVQINFDSWQGVGSWGDNSFATADTFGTGQALYIENNSLNAVRGSENDVSTSFETIGGARYVCRFNTITNMSTTGICSGHGTAWTGRPRGQRQVEVYYNTVGVDVAQGCDAINGLNGGTGYYFSNSVSASGGGCNYFLTLDIPRFVKTGTPWNSCDGTQPWDQYPWSSSTACLDQPGTGIGLGYTANNPPTMTSAPSTPCSTAGQCWPNPASDPVYEAGEVMTAGGLSTPVYVSTDGASTRVLANRDYYAEVSQSAQTSATSPFNGTSGTGYGTLAHRPTTCTPYVGYWATDQGTWNTYNSSQEGELFICTATNTWTLSYTPYIYPHPLTDPSTAPPSPPTNVQAVAH
jgi:hypothetical protein